MSEYKPIKENDFWNKYKPQINHIMKAKYPQYAETEVAPYAGTMYETFGEEVEYIRNLAKEGKIKHIWTVVDDENGDLVILSGAWVINRMGYIVTEKPWTKEGVHVEEE